MEILKVEHLVKQYGKGDNAVLAVNDISFSVEQGEFVAIVGSSGSGKSTLLHLLGGVDRPTSGKVYIQGEDIYSLNSDKIAIFRRRQAGLIYQFYNLIPILNVKENIEVGAYLSDSPLDIDELLNTLGLFEHRYKLPNQLSGGQQQRTAIGRAIVKNPDILLCDEPTGALDYNTGKQILKLLQDTCRKRGVTVVVITHNLALTAMGDKVIKVKNGIVDSVTVNENPLPVEQIEW